MKKTFWVLTLFAFVSSAGSSMIMPYIPIYGSEIGMSVGLTGVLVFVFYGTDTIFRIPIGSLSEVIGYHRIVLFGGITMVSASALYLISDPIPKLLFLAQMFFGLGFSITWVTIPSYVTIHDQSLSIYSFFVGLGWFVGPPAGGYIKENLGMYELFLAFTFTSILLVILSLFFYSFESSQKEKRERKGRHSIERIVVETVRAYMKGFKISLKGGRVAIAFGVSFIMFMSFSMAYSLVPLYFGSVGILSFQIGILQSMRSGNSTLIKLAVKKILSRVEDVTVLTIGMFGTGLSILLISMTESFYLLLILTMTWGLSAGMYFPIVLDLIAKGTEKKERGVAMGVRGTVGTFGSAVGVLLFSLLADRFSIGVSLSFVGSFVIVFGLSILILWHLVLKKQD